MGWGILRSGRFLVPRYVYLCAYVRVIECECESIPRLGDVLGCNAVATNPRRLRSWVGVIVQYLRDTFFWYDML